MQAKIIWQTMDGMCYELSFMNCKVNVYIANGGLEVLYSYRYVGWKYFIRYVDHLKHILSVEWTSSSGTYGKL